MCDIIRKMRQSKKIRNYTVVLHRADPDETGYWAEVPALPGCVTQGETVEETIGNAREAIEAWIACAIRNGDAVPVEPRLKAAKVHRIVLPVETPAA
jgi:predicted RNase H-like HicB family nuclease